jgi:hypothetical protein
MSQTKKKTKNSNNCVIPVALEELIFNFTDSLNNSKASLNSGIGSGDGSGDDFCVCDMFFIIIFLIDCAYMGKFYFDFA